MELIFGLAGIATGIAVAHFNFNRSRPDQHQNSDDLVADELYDSKGESRYLQAALIREARDISLLVAVSGSMVNVLATGQRLGLRTSLAAYVPPLPSVLPSALRQLTQMDEAENKAVQGLVSFYALVSFARNATLVFADKREKSDMNEGVPVESLAEAWRAAAKHGISVLKLLDNSEVRTEFGQKDKIAAQRLVELLRGVELGRAPCVRIDGIVIVPGRVERRVQVRRQVTRPTDVTINGVNHKMVVRDISEGGIGLEGNTGAEPGDRVSIKLECGAYVSGVAIWNSDGRLGVKLDQQLPNPVADD